MTDYTNRLVPFVCEHPEFTLTGRVARIKTTEAAPVNRFFCQVRVFCKICQRPFVFFGLPTSIDFDGPSTSADGLEALLSIGPQGETLPTKHGIAREYTVPPLSSRFPI